MIKLALDKSLLEMYYGDRTEDIIRVLTEYSDTQQQIIQSLQEAFGQGNTALQKSLHLHSPAFTYLGFPQLYDECRELEAKCKTAANLHDLSQPFQELIQYIEESGSLVKQELGQLQKTMPFD